MSNFFPDNALTGAWLGSLLLVELIAGFVLQRLDPGSGNRIKAWSLMAAATVIAHLITFSSPPGSRMMALIAALFLGMKTVVTTNARITGDPALSFPRWLAFSLTWPGMRPNLFTLPLRPREGWKGMAFNGSLCVAAGVGSIGLAGPIGRATGSIFVTTILFFIGSSLLVHYGLFTLAAAFWRKIGFDCGVLFRNPFSAQSLGVFWGQYWNLAFSEMTAIAVYQPMKGRLGVRQALLLSFGLSGLLHEVAISLPVRSGFGLPLAYFLLHCGLVEMERSLARRGILFNGWRGHLWVCFWLIAPLPILFHRPFLVGVVWPLIGVTP